MRLNDYLNRQDVPVAAFAQSVHRSRSLIDKILSGDRQPSAALIWRIEEVTDGAVSFNDFYPPSHRRRRQRSACMTSHGA
jgi:hypothetical protein